VNRMNTLLGRRQFLTITGAASTLALTAGAAKAAEKATGAACSTGANQTVKGVIVQKPIHKPVKMLTLEEMMAVAGASAPGAPGGAPGGSSAAGASGAPGDSSAAGGPAAFGAPRKGTPAIYIKDGERSPSNSKSELISSGKTGEHIASDLKIAAESGDNGGVFVKGIGSEYTLINAKIDITGDGPFGLGGPNSGAAADEYGSLTIRNSTITTDGQWRNATSVQNHSILKVYNSSLTAHGSPFTPDITNTAQKRQLEIDGNSRTHVTLSNSYSYFYYSTIVADGWAALSTDGSDGFVYLEANNCKVQTIKSGYGTYADGQCHCFINRCDFDVASMAAIIAGEADVTFSDTQAKCGSYFALIHSIGSSDEMGTLKVTNGEVKCKDAGVLIKSANAEIVFDGTKIVSENHVLLKSATSSDPQAAKAAKTKGKEVYGIHATLKNMDVEGDVIHTTDKENRGMTVYLESTTLRGAIKDASLKMNRLSKWIATADSNVTIIGDVDVSQIDAPAGVTITAVASVSGKYKLASCGTLILTAS
jgi:hypothetical protein